MPSVYIKDKQKLKGIRYMLLAVAAINAAAAIVFAYLESFRDIALPMYLESLAIGLLAYVIPIFVYAKITKMTAKEASEKFYLRKCKNHLVVLAAIMGVCCQFVIIVINLPLNLIYKASSSYMPKSEAELAAAIVIIAIIPAIFEEFLFRGIVFGSMAEMNSKAALIFSSVMFAVLHADLYGFLGYFFMGIVLAFVLRRCDSVYPAVAFHFTNNLTALLLGYFDPYLQYSPSLIIVLFLIGIIGFLVLLILFGGITKKPKSIEKIKCTQILGQSFINFPIILCFVVIVASVTIMRML